jgi:hypothetical protein
MDHYDKIISILDKPYFKNLESMGIDKDHYNEIFKRIYNETVTINIGEISNGITFEGRYIERYISSESGRRLYNEISNGGWYRYEYDNNGNKLYIENSEGYWEKRDYDGNGYIIYSENSNGYWFKR